MKHVRRLSTRFISLKTIFCRLANSGGNHRTLKSDDPTETEVDIDALSPDLNALTAISKQLAAMVSSRSRSAQAKTKPMAHVLACDWYCGRSGDWQCQWPMGAWLVHHNVLPHDGNVLRLKAIKDAHWGVTA